MADETTENSEDGTGLDRLFETIRARKSADPESSYTAKLLARGVPKCAQKFGEEAVETVIAATAGDREAVISESADLLYHWLVLLEACGVRPEEVYAALAKREGTSGLAEKAARNTAAGTKR